MKETKETIKGRKKAKGIMENGRNSLLHLLF